VETSTNGMRVDYTKLSYLLCNSKGQRNVRRPRNKWQNRFHSFSRSERACSVQSWSRKAITVLLG